MNDKRRSAVLMLWAACCWVLVHANASMAADEHCHSQQPAAESRAVRSEVAYTVPDVALIDQNGQEVALRALLTSDRPVFLNFIFTTCTTICPVLTAGFSSFRSRLGDQADSVRLVSITIDPEHDTPAVLARYAARFKASGDWTFLTGSLGDVNAAMRAFDAYVTKKMNHRPLTFLLAPGSTQWVRIEGMMSAADYVQERERLAGP